MGHHHHIPVIPNFMVSRSKKENICRCSDHPNRCANNVWINPNMVHMCVCNIHGRRFCGASYHLDYIPVVGTGKITQLD